MSVPVPQKINLGWEQRGVFQNADLIHENVPEFVLSSALEIRRCSNDLKEIRFLILGDQNAGKTTFLHALSVGSMEISSHIPAISGSFVNARFLLTDIERERGEEISRILMDEPPFLDTDIGRTSLLFNNSDFRFLCFQCGVDSFESVAPFICLELAEFGGDHLDRLVENNLMNCEIIEKSRDIIKSSDFAVYFMNASASIETLDNATKQRLEILSSLRPDLQLLVIVTRLSDTVIHESSETTTPVEPQSIYPIEEELFVPDPVRDIRDNIMCRHIRELFERENIFVSSVRVARHLKDQTVSVNQVVRTVAAMIRLFL